MDWFKQNGFMANPHNFQSMILGDTDQEFSFVVNGIHIKKRDDIDLFEVNIDSKLTFNKHVLAVCDKVNKQLQVMNRFKKLVCRQTRQRLYNAFILPAFQYCSDVWHHCSARSRDKLEKQNKQTLRVVLDDQSRTCDEILRKLHIVTLEQRRIQNMSVTVYKCLHVAAPSNMYRKSYERECISGFMSTSDVLKVLKIARALGECNLRNFKTSRVTIKIIRFFIYYIFNKFTHRRFLFEVVRARILHFLGLLFFQSPKHSTRSV